MPIVGTLYLNGCNYQFGYDVISQSVANNTSTVSFYGILNVTNSYVAWSSGKAWVHTAQAGMTTRYNKGGHVVVQGNFTFPHNADGTLTLAPGYGIETTFTSGSGIATFSLPKINRVAVTNSVNGNDIEQPFKVNYTKYIDTYTYKLRISVPNVTVLETINYSTSGEEFSLSQTSLNYLYQNMTSNKINLGFAVETWQGSTKLSEGNEVIITCYLNNSEPTYDVTYEDTNSTTLAITNNNQQIIRNNSILQFNLTNITAYKLATISTATVTIDGTTYNGTISNSTCTIEVGELNLSNNIDATVKVTDSRNISTTKTVPITILDWQLPSGITTLERQSNYYSETNIKVNGEYSSLDNKNVLTIKVRYKKVSDSSYGSYITLQDDVTSVIVLDNLYTWDVQVLVSDLLGSTTYNYSIGIGIPILYIDRNKRSVGIECFPKNENTIEVFGGDLLNILGIKQDTWSSSDSYSKRDIVAYNRTLYENLTGNNNTSPDTDSTNWQETSILSNLLGISKSSDYITFGNIGICWGQAHPTYANANVLLANAISLPLSFTNGRCIASTVNVGNLGAELDAIAKVPSVINGSSMNLALHSNSAKFTTGSTGFYINYIVIGQIS